MRQRKKDMVKSIGLLMMMLPFWVNAQKDTALNPPIRYRISLEDYREGKRDYSIMPYLVKTARDLKEKGVADSITQDYLHNYLYKLNGDELYTKDNIELIVSGVRSSAEKGFSMFYLHPDRVDEVMKQKGYSQGVVDYFITKEEIGPHLYKDKKPVMDMPDWHQMEATITRKYNRSYAERTILNAQIRWNRMKGDWTELVRGEVLKVDRYGLDTAGFWAIVGTNNMIYNDIFLHDTDKLILNKALDWMIVLLQKDPNNAEEIDTYANILYKVGRTEEALKWEKIAAASEKPDILKDFELMQSGQKTW